MAEYRRFLSDTLKGKNYLSIALYIVVFYLVFVYVALPAVYAFTPISYLSAVVSGSMSHDVSTIQLTYYNWLYQHGFNSSTISKWPFQNGISIGSFVIAYKASPSQIKVGDVIIYKVNYEGIKEDVIHRVINETEINGTYYYTTKGDANPVSYPFEIDIPYSSVIGKVGTVIPYLGYPRYALYVLGNLI
ncbi:MAG: signal peptidase I [Candidatus Parvarchaeota archaeon]|nr:signal peptidase I [Candidatus Parvarchaeota archaeon]